MARTLRAALAAVATAVLLAGCGGPREAVLPAGSTVLVVGDSITAGYGVGADAAWPAELARLSGWRVVAAGVNGERSAGGRERLPALLDEHAPALVIVELGGNDMLRGTPAAETIANLAAMADTARAHGAKVVLMAAPQPSVLGAVVGLSAAPLYRQAAEQARVPLLDDALPTVLSDASLRQDAVHPNRAGHRRLAEAAADALARLGLLARR